MLRRTLFALALLASCTALTGSQPPPDPCLEPAPKLECVLAEGAELDGAAGFSVPFFWNSTGTPRCIIYNGDNPAQIIAASPCYKVDLPAPVGFQLWAADFRGQLNLKNAIVYGYRDNIVSNGVKAKIVNNPVP
jgi:hypothetical protein